MQQESIKQKQRMVQYRLQLDKLHSLFESIQLRCNQTQRSRNCSQPVASKKPTLLHQTASNFYEWA